MYKTYAITIPSLFPTGKTIATQKPTWPGAPGRSNESGPGGIPRSGPLIRMCIATVSRRRILPIISGRSSTIIRAIELYPSRMTVDELAQS